jgi:hypothetical protein
VIMRTNISEVFNFILKGICALSVCGIVDYTFYKCNEYFTMLGSMRATEGERECIAAGSCRPSS